MSSFINGIQYCHCKKPTYATYLLFSVKDYFAYFISFLFQTWIFQITFEISSMRYYSQKTVSLSSCNIQMSLKLWRRDFIFQSWYKTSNTSVRIGLDRNTIKYKKSQIEEKIPPQKTPIQSSRTISFFVLSGLNDLQTVLLACIATLVSLAVTVFTAFGIRYVSQPQQL